MFGDQKFLEKIVSKKPPSGDQRVIKNINIKNPGLKIHRSLTKKLKKQNEWWFAALLKLFLKNLHWILEKCQTKNQCFALEKIA